MFGIIENSGSDEHLIAVENENELDAWLFYLEREIRTNIKQQFTTFSSHSARYTDLGTRRTSRRQSVTGGNACLLPQQLADNTSIEMNKMARFAEIWKREAVFWKNELARHVENENCYCAEADCGINAMRTELDKLEHAHPTNTLTVASLHARAGAATHAITSAVPLPADDSDSDSDSDTPCASTVSDYNLSSSSSSECLLASPKAYSRSESSSAVPHCAEQPYGEYGEPEEARALPARRSPPLERADWKLESRGSDSDSESGPPEISDTRFESDSAGSSAVGSGLPGGPGRLHSSSADPELAWRHALLSSSTTHALIRAAAAWFAEPLPLVRCSARRGLHALHYAAVARRLGRLRVLEHLDPRLRSGVLRVQLEAAGKDISSSESGDSDKVWRCGARPLLHGSVQTKTY
jgi:hypothetical protein